MVEEASNMEVAKSTKPLSRPKLTRGFSINAILNKEEQKEKTSTSSVTHQGPVKQNHFTDTDVKAEWTQFIKQLKYQDAFIYNAIKNFKVDKKDEKTILVAYPSDSAREEFEKVSPSFFNNFRRKIGNSLIEVEYQKDAENLKVEMITKKVIFEKLVEINPVLKDLDELLKFDMT